MTVGVAVSVEAREAMLQRSSQGESCAIGPTAQRDVSRVVFYRLTRKFVDSEESVSKDSESIVYYTLSIGHHTGVIDCLEEALSCSEDEFRRILTLLPSAESRYKLEGVFRCQEIQIDRSHLGVLGAAVRESLSSCEGNPELFSERAWLFRFSQMLDVMTVEPAVYYMGRLRD